MIPALESDLTRLLTAARDFDFNAWVDTLRQRDRHLIVLHTLIASVGNGGFAQWVNFGYRDHQEAVTAFGEKRKPSFGTLTGRD